MYTLTVVTKIGAPACRCFDLARSVDVHVRSAGRSGERVVGGRTSGLLELGELVTWEGRHLGIRQRLSSRITAFDRPTFFQDRMERGAIRHLEHDHRFDSIDTRTTVMADVLRFAAPLGAVGWIAERLVIGPHLRRFVIARGTVLRTLAESEGWREFLESDRAGDQQRSSAGHKHMGA